MAAFAYLAVKELAGETTVANVVIMYFTSEDNDYGLPWFLAAIFAAWALFEAKLRRSKTRALQGHIQKLETLIDPNRTSSGLLPTGETNPKDERL